MKKVLTVISLVLGGAVYLLAQTAVLMPLPSQPFTANGQPISNGYVYTYQTGTYTPQATYTDYTGATQNSNPVLLNSGGYPTCSGNQCGIWFLINTSYRVVVQNSAHVQIYMIDGVPGLIATTPGTVAQVTATPPLTSSGGVDPNIAATLSGTGLRLQTTNINLGTTNGDVATVDANGNTLDSGTLLSTLARALYINGAAVNVGGNTTAQQILGTYTSGSGAFNTLKRTFRVTSAANIVALNTSETISFNGITFTAPAATPDIIAVLYDATCTVTVTGASGSYTCRQKLSYANSGTSGSPFFTNATEVQEIATYSPVNITGTFTVNDYVSFSTASTTNTASETVFSVEQLN